ncbi:MAG: glycosyl hydrolase family 25 [Ruminococcus sp.]|nr:glycosyl hydrolase family 25 [Ruminococcus sp.]
MKKKRIAPVLIIAAGLLLTFIAWAWSCLFARADVNRSKYPVFGVDVSNYQGDIDWDTLEAQGVQFAFIKATEGSGHTDESVRRNLERAAQTGIKVSCYHFFSFDSAGETQAENYIGSVSPDEIQLPPVVDIEYYGDKRHSKPSLSETEEILRPLLERLEEYYGVKPIIYTTIPVYYRYVRKSFPDYPLWIRCTQAEPDMLVDWTFWQYTDKGRLEGYFGEEEYIDYNVFCGSEEEFFSLYK